MTTLRRFLTATALAFPLLALAQAPAEAPSENRQRVEKIKATDPQLWAKLQHNLAVWKTLSPERQAELRQFDQDLQSETPVQRGRFERVLERYADWLAQLPEAERQSVLTAPDRKTRLQRVRHLKELQWLQRLPKGQRDKIKHTPQPERAELIKRLRQDDLDERLDWQITLRNPPTAPNRLEAFPKDTREYLDKNFLPLLTAEAEKRLRDAEGRTPRFQRVFIDLFDTHPLPLLGPIGPTSFKDLPPTPGLLFAIEKDKRLHERYKEAENRWPGFGVFLGEIARHPLGKKVVSPLSERVTPKTRADLPPSVQEFITRKLVPALDRDEAFQLEKAEDEWPHLQQTVLDLARKHNLVVPAGTNRFDYLDRYRWRPLHAHPGGRRGEWPWLPQ